jgi:lipoate-protein ligase A
VILTPNTLVFSVKLKINDNSHDYFRLINDRIIQSLENLGIKDVSMKGISDISIGEKKILGSSIYRKKDMLFYHAVLNVSEKTEIIQKYIKHPKREPDYRKGRKHCDFVSSIKAEGYDISISEIRAKLNAYLFSLKSLS